MLTYKFFASRYGKLIVRLRNNNRKTEINLLEDATQEEIDMALGEVASKHGNRRLKMKLAGYTAILSQISNQLKDEGRTGLEVGVIADMFRERAGFERQGAKGEFVTWFEKFMDSKATPGTRSVYKQTLDKLRKLYPDADYLKFSQLTVAWLEDFEAKCAETSTKNARNIHLRNIRAVFNYALLHDLDIPYPFRRFKIRPEKTRKRNLKAEELRQVFNYPVEKYAEIYRDMFKLIFMLVGINCVDLYHLAEIRDGRVEYKRAKTGGLYSIKVEPEAMEIIERYKGEKALLCLADRWGDYKNFLHQCNKALQAMGAERKGLGGKKGEGLWPELTTYWARHSWATIARKIGVAKDDIALALGHSSGHDVTEIYIEDENEKIDIANRKVLDWVLYGKG